MMLYSIQFLRGFAALLVVITHIIHRAMQNGICTDDWFHMGGTGVDLFFVISGFIMCYTTHDKMVSFGHFMKLRAERIIPLYWVMTTCALILYLMPFKIFNTAKSNISILDSYFLFPFGKHYLVGTGWTLSYEFYFYFIFSIGLLLSSRSYCRYFYIITIISILSFIGWFVKEQNPLIDFIFSHWLVEFAFGIVSFVIYKNIIIPFKWNIGMILCGFSILLYYSVDNLLMIGPYRVVFGGIPMFLIFNGFLHLEKFFKKTTNYCYVFGEYLGNSSYSLYLTHPFILALTSRIYIKLGFISAPIFIVLNLIASILFGFFVYRYIEQPLLKWVRNRI